MNPVIIDWYPPDEGGGPRIVKTNDYIHCIFGKISQKEQMEIIANAPPWKQSIFEGYIQYEC